jgi:hypothetical protein
MSPLLKRLLHQRPGPGNRPNASEEFGYMNSRFLISGVLTIGCVAALWLAAQRQQQLIALRTQQQQLLAQLAPSPPAVGTAVSEPATASASSPPVSGELLQLRAEVTQLTRQKRALAGVMSENEHLRAELAARTNAVPAMQGP